MTENEAIKEFQQNIDMPFGSNISREASELAIQALETIKKLSDRKMTTEVLENYMQFEDECVEKGFTFKSVVEAREKQIPKKPIIKHINTSEEATEIEYTCFVCGTNFVELTPCKEWCPYCGNKFDWE